MWLLSADLGQAHDYTAIGAVRATLGPIRSAFVGHLERFRGESYPTVVNKIARLAQAEQLAGCDVVLDAGGVGRAVVDMVRAALPGRRVWAITLTGGSKMNRGDHQHDLRVPKKDVISAAQVMLQERRLTWPVELGLRSILESELANYQVKISAHLNETFDVGREGDHDDTVCCVAQACWLARNLPAPMSDDRVAQLVLNPEPEPPTSRTPPGRMAAIVADLPHLFGGE